MDGSMPAAHRTVVRQTVNFGRGFYTCAACEARRCGFFRWSDDADQHSQTRLRSPMSADEVRHETREIDVQKQLRAWAGVRQGTEEWHRLRACRVTASAQGAVVMVVATVLHPLPAAQLRHREPHQSICASGGPVARHPLANELRQRGHAIRLCERKGGVRALRRVPNAARGPSRPAHLRGRTRDLGRLSSRGMVLPREILRLLGR